ncbi:uncharacterized protein LOC125496849 [Beta vulgaris subsp. vulgaris]|uniref:uncharacterized protein LOC125496849 n=1 Tax=Beta vulgaris subsp. vulgaris TaxID=3555 RepID=UPI002036E8C5|nr:uncharacterized protein LOC125496849 [Beta vulgaris subsp. vulgaris]
MRFLFECVSCYTMTSSPSEEDPPSPTTPRTEETRSLVTSTQAAKTHRRRKRTSTRGSSADWKPSLFAIAEDNAVSTTPQKPVNRQHVSVTSVVSSRNVKHCGPSSVQVNARSRAHDYGRESLAMAFPAFSAAPFMF